MIPSEGRFVPIQNHTTQAFQVMYELRERNELCDVTLKVNNENFNAHKVVLAGCSPYLRAMFTNGMLETDKSVIEIHGVDAQTMNMLLEFMYKGIVEVTTENVQSLLQGASMLNLLALRNVCCQFLQQHLDASNCLGIQSFADMYSCTELESAARRYIYSHFLDAIQHEEFLQLSDERLIDLLKSDQLQVNTEEQVFEAVAAWVETDPTREIESACRVLMHTRLALLDPPYLENIVLRTDFVRNCPKCQNTVAMALHTKNDNNALAMISNRAQPLGIFVLGGRDGSNSQLSSMERYDFLNDQWVPMGSMKIARTAVSAASHNGVLYAVGGECAQGLIRDDTVYLRSLEAYNPIMKEWNILPDMKVARSFVAAVATGGVLYAIGGEDRSTSFNIVERYNPKSETWCFVPSMHQKRAGAGITVCDGKIYVAGGFDKSFQTDRASVECYDPELEEWSFVSEMETPRSGLVLATVDHYLYAIGGRSRFHMYYDMAERYNTLTHEWQTITPMNTSRAWPAVAVIDKRIYVMGGFDGSNRLRSVESYDPDRDEWTYINNMQTNRAGCGAAVL